MGVIDLGYSQGLTGVWWLLPGAIALLPLGFLLASKIRALAVFTLPDILTSAYGDRVSIPAALMIAVSWSGVVAAQMVAGARLLDSIFPIVGFGTALVGIAIVFVLYTFWGGQLSVVRTDSWQLILFIVGLLTCIIFVVFTPWGFSSGSRLALPSEHFRFPVSLSFTWYDLLVYYPIIFGLPFLVGPDLYSRILCAKDESVARRSVLIAALGIVPVAFLLTVLGILIRTLFADLPTDSALPTVIAELLPVGLRGLIVAGFLAAIMSTADTTLVTTSTILTNNVVQPLRPLQPATQLRTAKALVLVVGALALVVALFQRGIIESLALGYTIFVGGVVIPTILSFYRNRLGITSTGAMWAVIVGGTAAIIGAFNNGDWLRLVVGEFGDTLFTTLLGPRYPNILPVVLSLLTVFGVSWLTRNRRNIVGGSKI